MYFCLACVGLVAACAPDSASLNHPSTMALSPGGLSNPAIDFYSSAGREHSVTFQGEYKTSYTRLEEFNALDNYARTLLLNQKIKPLMAFLFGPLTRRQLGGIQRGQQVVVRWDGAHVVDGRVRVPYDYTGTWILRKDLGQGNSLSLPVPLDLEDLYTENWKNCTDSEPDHQTLDFFWYFWDPARSGCDHVAGRQYETYNVAIGPLTLNEVQSYPEYPRLLQSAGRANNLQMTFAFGYVKDPELFDPLHDSDYGMNEFRSFLKSVDKYLDHTLDVHYSTSDILQGEYRGASNPRLVIGRRFLASVNGVNVTINVVATAGIDQMQIFAKSFAHDHDGFFGWMGHSRVGSGFDANNFNQILSSDPGYYSITQNYQLIYWGGCNSYSYYTLPFFDFKSRYSNGQDPKGTKGLDIIANGLPSYFSLNALNAMIFLRSLTQWNQHTSYQSIVDSIERGALNAGIYSLAVVLGDEDNPR
jgi:hypothetical protein